MAAVRNGVPTRSNDMTVRPNAWLPQVQGAVSLILLEECYKGWMGICHGQVQYYFWLTKFHTEITAALCGLTLSAYDDAADMLVNQEN